jgi:hypothetical protein
LRKLVFIFQELKRGLESRINEFETDQVKLGNQNEMLTNQLKSLEEVCYFTGILYEGGERIGVFSGGVEYRVRANVGQG